MVTFVKVPFACHPGNQESPFVTYAIWLGLVWFSKAAELFDMSITADIFISSVYKARNGFRLFFMDCTASYSQQEITSLPLSFVLN